MRHASCSATANTLPAPPSVQYFHCDLADKSSILKASSAVRASLGHPTVLINNAGCARGKTILDTTERDLNLTFRVNAFAHYYLAQQFLPAMVAQFSSPYLFPIILSLSLSLSLLFFSLYLSSFSLSISPHSPY